MFAESFIAVLGLLALQESVPPPIVGSTPSLPVARAILPAEPSPQKKDRNSLGVSVTSKASAVMDVKSGSFLYKKDADRPYSIASLSKLITAMVVLDEDPQLQDVIELLGEDEPKGFKVSLLRGEKMTKEELLSMLLVGSDNEAANAFARLHGGRELFEAKMNRKAAELGMRQAFFADPSGLDARNRASAADVALAMRAALGYEKIRETTKHRSLTIVGRTSGHPYVIKSTNLLLGSGLNTDGYEIEAGKTGSLDEAGFCLAQTTKDPNGHEIIVVSLGSETHFSRFDDVKALTYWTFQAYEWPTP